MQRNIMERASLLRETCFTVQIVLKANCGAQQLHYPIRDALVHLVTPKPEKLLLLVLYRFSEEFSPSSSISQCLLDCHSSQASLVCGKNSFISFCCFPQRLVLQ